jgi:hypothetical protein
LVPSEPYLQPLSLICSVPYFNSFSSSQIQTLVDASERAQLRPGETLALLPAEKLDDKQFFIVCSGSLAIAGADAVIARAVQQANLSPKFKLSVGDYFASHQLSNARVIAMEPVETLMLHLSVIATISETVVRDIEATNCDAGSETAETASFKHWALQYTLAMQRPAVTSQAFSSVAPKGFATNSVKQFSKDFLVHFSPENELDHTLEYMKLTLMGVFKARRVRMFIVDYELNKLVVKVRLGLFFYYGANTNVCFCFTLSSLMTNYLKAASSSSGVSLRKCLKCEREYTRQLWRRILKAKQQT